MERPLNLKQSAVIISILASLWLLNHPYSGIWHDSILYMFMALNKLNPGTYAGDLFLKFGSQDDYTIFPTIYAMFIKLLGVHKSALILSIFGQILWGFSSVTLFRTFLKGKELSISLAILFFIPGYYGGFNCFRYAEPFLTPRIFSEALCILGLTSIIKKKYILSSVLFLISFFIHPLITLYAGIVVYIYLAMAYPCVLFSAPILVIVIFTLGLLKIEPISGILRIISIEWDQILKVRSSYMFTYQWPLGDWAETFFSLSITAAACWFSKGIMRRIFLSSIIGACCGILVNIIGGELLSIEFIMQIQAWRCLWILQVISALAAAVLITNFFKLQDNRFLLYSFFVLSWYCVSLGTISFAITLLFLYLAIRASKNDLPYIQIKHPLIFVVLIMDIIIPEIIYFIRIISKSNFNLILLSNLADYSLFYIFLPLVLLLVIFIFYYYDKKIPSTKIVFLAVIIMISSAGIWDRQSKWSKMLESNKEEMAFFRDILPEDATILWDCLPEMAWIGAGRKCYISAHQGSGAVFSSGTAFEYAKRVNKILPMMKENPLKSKKIGYRIGWGIDESKFESNYADVCREADELDFIISKVNVPGKSIAHWHSPVPKVSINFLEDGTFEETKDQDFYLYDCREYKKK